MRRSSYSQRLIGRSRFRGTLPVAMLVGAMTSAAHGTDAEFGRYLSSECITCHGTAKSDSTIPNIFGLGEAHIVEVMRAYRARALPNEVMQTVAARLKDDEISALAAYFATAKPASTTRKPRGRK